jgi:hypothetical protein
MFSQKYTTKNVIIKHSQGTVKDGWVNFSINKDSIYIYISRDNNRIYWIGRKKGLSAKLLITFSDTKNMITINKSNKIIFNKNSDYEKIKKKVIYYKHMKITENKVEFTN